MIFNLSLKGLIVYFCTRFYNTSELIMGDKINIRLHKVLKAYILLMLSGLFLVPTTGMASSSDGDFNAGEMIVHHIADAHEIHFTDDFAIYLPVIIYDDGFKFFSSSNFYHNEQVAQINGKDDHYFAYDGYILYHEHIYKGDQLRVDQEGEVLNASVLDLSITKSVAGLLGICVLMIFLFKSIASKYKKREGQAPKGIQNLFETLILFVRDEIARPSIGPNADRFVPFLLSIFFFIWMSNMLGLIPFLGGFNITGTMGVTIVLAFLVFVVTTISGNKHYWGHLFNPPGVPGFVKLILVPIEVLGIFIKPFVLMVRLTANITAGHIIILAFVSLIFILGGSSAGAEVGVGIGSTLFMIFMNFIELLVAFLQAYVFTLLAALYFGSAVEEAH